jgi:hypothetical protein
MFRDIRRVRPQPLTHLQRMELQQLVVKNQYELVEDVIFANTFFADPAGQTILMIATSGMKRLDHGSDVTVF